MSVGMQQFGVPSGFYNPGVNPYAMPQPQQFATPMMIAPQPSQAAPPIQAPQPAAPSPTSVEEFMRLASGVAQVPQQQGQAQVSAHQAQQQGLPDGILRSVLAARGYQIPEHFSDGDIVEAFVTGLPQISQYNELKQNYDRLIPIIRQYQAMENSAQTQQPVAGQQVVAAASQAASQDAATGNFNPPEFDQSWMNMVKFDEDSGRYVTANSMFNPIVADKVNAYVEYRRRFQDEFVRNPADTVWKAGLEKKIGEALEEFRDRLQGEKQAQEEYQNAIKFVTDNFNRFYVTDQNGSPVADPVTGQYVLTPQGKAFQYYQNEATSLGIGSPVDKQRYASEKLQLMEMQAEKYRLQTQQQMIMQQQGQLPQQQPGAQYQQTQQAPFQPQQQQPHQQPQDTFGVARTMSEFQTPDDGLIHAPGQEHALRPGPEPLPSPAEEAAAEAAARISQNGQNGHGPINRVFRDQNVPLPAQGQYSFQSGPVFGQQAPMQQQSPHAVQSQVNEQYVDSARAAMRSPQRSGQTPMPVMPSGDDGSGEGNLNANTFMKMAKEVASESGVSLT